MVDVTEAAELARSNPLSFLHVSRAEIDLPPGVHPYSDEVYAKAVTNMAGLKTRAPLITEAHPSLYLYRLRMGLHVQTGIAGCFSMDEYEDGRIMKHEKTRREKEDDRTRHMLELRAQTGPVFLTYRAEPEIGTLVAGIATAGAPLFAFTAPDGIEHHVWRADPQDTAALVAAFNLVPSLYIADGHHRAASAARVRRQLHASEGAGEWDTFLAVAFPDDEVQVLPYNRIVADLASHTPESLLRAIAAVCAVSEGSPSPQRRGDVSMFLGDRWYTVALGDPPADEPDRRLDVSLLQERILSPILGIGDITTDKRIDFVGGIRGTRSLEALVASGRAAVAFSMYPVSVQDIMAISDAGGIMPPKSTWFEPKLRDGLLSHPI